MTGGKTKKDKKYWNAFKYMPGYIFYIYYMKRKIQDLETPVSQLNGRKKHQSGQGKGHQDSGLPTMGNTKL